MASNNFTIGQRVRVVRLGDWNGTPPDKKLGWYLAGFPCGTVVKPEGYDTIAVKMDLHTLGVLQFLCNELEAIEVDESSGGE